jgi:transcriptional regulator with XRE-family HTH domain
MFAVMNETWRDRLSAALAAEGKSKREVSLAADLGPGYVHSILSEGKDPTVDNLLKVCQAVGVSPLKVIFGLEVSKDAADLLSLWASAQPETRQGILAILRSHKAA